MPMSLHVEHLFPVGSLSIILPRNAEGLVFERPELVTLHVIKVFLVVYTENLGFALQQLHIVLVVDVEVIGCQGPDLLFHDQRLLAIDTEGGNDAHGIGQRCEHNRPGT